MSSYMTVCASHAPGLDRDAAGVLGQDFRAAMARVRRSVAEFDPELVVVFGGDHRRAFAHVVPTFGVVLHGTLRAEGGAAGGPLPVPEPLVRRLAESIIDRGFDLAVARGVALDHAFGQPLRLLLPEAATVPVVPIAVNCASPPLPAPGRVHEFGRVVGEVLEPLDRRILLIGTGGLSHAPPSLLDERHDKTEEERRAQLEAGFELASRLVKPGWDMAFLRAMEKWDVETLLAMAEHATREAGVGANEVRTWIAAGAAGGTDPFSTVGYEPVSEWITGMGITVRGGW
ncbi:3-carboxyethylcatechol 2,3-dioxygenase [Streptomyces sp. NPDC005811]|uniref:3-carboxyethylcatechol 2,3-dioxygenase n=1 Tax=Streptomyces sp. NPDC005811 TaxID=3154565 RepID=UPI00340CDD87